MRDTFPALNIQLRERMPRAVLTSRKHSCQILHFPPTANQTKQKNCALKRGKTRLPRHLGHNQRAIKRRWQPIYPPKIITVPFMVSCDLASMILGMLAFFAFYMRNWGHNDQDIYLCQSKRDTTWEILQTSWCRFLTWHGILSKEWAIFMHTQMIILHACLYNNAYKDA